MARTITSVIILCGVLSLSACQLTPAPTLITCPLPIAEQTAQVLDIVPLGTQRDEAIKRLEAAGIGGDFNVGDSKSTYYCHVWKRDDKERWHINVVLLFDENGTLYGTRPQLASTAPTHEESPSEAAAPQSAKNPADPFSSFE